MASEPSQDSLDTLLALGGARDCIDEDAVDQEEVAQHALGVTPNPTVAAHLAECGYCRALAEEYGKTRSSRASLSPLVGVVGALAAAACIAFYVASSTEDSGVTYEISSVHGTVRSERSDGSTRGTVRFAATSLVEITVRPTAYVGPVGDLQLWVFIDAGKGPLRQVGQVDITSLDDDGARSFLVRGDGRGVFGDDPGRKRLAMSVSSHLPPAEGLELTAARQLQGTQWVVLEVDYLGVVP